MNKNIVLIQSHCNTEEKKEILISNIEKLKEFDLDILLYSHIPLSEEIINHVDYFIYDSSNPIMWEERRHYYWRGCDEYKLESTVPDYGWTVFNQMIGSSEFIRNKNYDNVIIFCYDLIIDDVVYRFLKNPEPQIFEHRKISEKSEENSYTNLGTALVFSIIEKNNFLKLIDSLSQKEYEENYWWTAEKYFENKLISLNLYVQPEFIVSESISESKNIFNFSSNNDYDLFIDNQSLLKFIFKNNTQQNQKIIVNDNLLTVEPGNYIFNQKIENIETIGLLSGSDFESWIKFIKIRKINKITFN